MITKHKQEGQVLKNSKYVTDWFVTLTPNGVYTVVFNTTERRMSYHAFNDTTYIFGNENDLKFDDENEVESQESWESRMQEIPEFLPNPRPKGITYLTAHSQSKDQVYFYYIPYKHAWVKKGDKLLLTGKNPNHE